MSPPLRTPPFTKESWEAFARHEPVGPPEKLSWRDYCALDDGERARYDLARRTHHARLGPYALGQVNDALDRLLRLVEANELLPDDKIRPGAALDGDPLLGKTTLLRLVGARYHREMRRRYGAGSELGDFTPVCHSGMTDELNTKGLSRRLCDFYGVPVRDRESGETITGRLVKVMIECRTTLVLIDDVHRVNQRDRQGRRLNEHMKDLMDRVPATFLLAGVGLQSSGLFREGKSRAEAHLAQIGGRFQRIAIERIDYDTPNGAHEWRALLAAIEQDLRLCGRHTLRTNAMAEYLYRRTSGSIGSLIDLVRMACETLVLAEATSTQPPALDIALLDTIALSERAESLYRSSRRVSPSRTKDRANGDLEQKGTAAARSGG